MQFFWKPGEGIQVCEIAARFFGYEHELTDIVYGFNMEELLLASLYDRIKLEKMLTEHDIHKPHCCGAVIYFQGRLLTIGDQSKAVLLGEKNRSGKTLDLLSGRRERSLNMVRIRIWHYIT